MSKWWTGWWLGLAMCNESRRAGVSAFGLSGTNAHVVLEEAPARWMVGRRRGDRGRSDSAASASAAVSGRDEAALRAQAGRYADWLSGHAEVDWSDVVSTAALHRTHFASRAAVSARDATEAVEALRALGEGLHTRSGVSGRSKGRAQRQAGVSVYGAGSAAAGHGSGAAAIVCGFPHSVRGSLQPLRRTAGLPLRAVLFAEEGSEAAAKLDETAYAQPALFAVEVALFRQLEQWGVEPDILLGHSIGELAAAHVAGVWSLRDACRVVAARGRLMQALPKGGAMVALEASEAEVLPLLADGVGDRGAERASRDGDLGDEAAVVALAEQFRGQGRRTNRLQVSHAFIRNACSRCWTSSGRWCHRSLAERHVCRSRAT